MCSCLRSSTLTLLTSSSKVATSAHALSRKVARIESIWDGISSGAALAVGLVIAARDEMTVKLTVVIIPRFVEAFTPQIKGVPATTASATA